LSLELREDASFCAVFGERWKKVAGAKIHFSKRSPLSFFLAGEKIKFQLF